MEYLADTVTIVRHFAKTGQIGKTAKFIIEETEKGKNHIFISVISLVEIMYLSQKMRININLAETLQVINTSINYSTVDLTPHIVSIAETIDFPELFDRLIIATAEYLKIPILTSDEKIQNMKNIKTIWK
ncbi:PIN domain-containing protein [Candidatus Desantisbacteria bacterium]|nr:PIN domain-containing protein [Candidatus Desantisbacteria bacterium]